MESYGNNFLIHIIFLTMISSLFYRFLKVVYPYEYMDDSKTLNENLLPGKEDFYSPVH